MLYLSFLFFAITLGSQLFSDSDRISMYAVHIPTGTILIDEQSDKSFIPASCLKIVTTAAALNLLDPKSSFETHLTYSGDIDENGILHGSLYIQGGGDPCLGSNRINPLGGLDHQIESWIQALEKAGIKQVLGKIIGDASIWEEEMAVPSWGFEDLGNYYGAGACGLSFHENSYKLFFKPGLQVGNSTQIIRTEPAISHLILQNNVTTGPSLSGDKACIYGVEFCNTRFVRGTIPIDSKEFCIQGSIPNPPAFTADCLSKKMQEKGITIANEDFTSTKRTIIHTTISPSIEEIVFQTNQHSINLYAEHLLKKIGKGSTTGGVEAISNFWRSKKIDLTGFFMADGSGLSRKNLVTTKILVEILSYMHQSKVFSPFLASFPCVKQEIQAKSGTMAQVKGYTGYHGDVAFAILINQDLDSQKTKKRIEAFFEELSSKSLHLGFTKTSKI